MKCITLLKEKDVLNFIIVLFSVLQKESSDKELTSEGSKIFIRKKDPSEITKLQADTKELEKKIFGWIDNRAATRLDLTEDESNLFRHCAHAAHYFMTEKKEVSPAREGFLKLYEHFFKK